jgi:ABC-type transport system substrate-binding protein
MYLGMNVGYEPLSRSDVRDAVRYAIDYDAIIMKFYKALLSKSKQSFRVGFWL